MLITTLVFIFSKFFSFILFLGKFGLKMWSSWNWLKFRTEVDYYMVISILLFVFSKFLSFIFSLGIFGPKIWRSSNWLKFGTVVDCYMVISILLFVFSKFLLFIFSSGKFGPKIWRSSNWLKCCTGVLYAYYNFNVYFFKILIIHIFWANLVPKSEVLHFDWNLVQRYIAICLLWF